MKPGSRVDVEIDGIGDAQQPLRGRPTEYSTIGGLHMKVAVIGAARSAATSARGSRSPAKTSTFIVRGAQPGAHPRPRLRLDRDDGSEQCRAQRARAPTTTRRPAAGLVILAMKAHQVEASRATCRSCSGPTPRIVTMQNGIPYWYFHDHGGALSAPRAQRRPRRRDRRRIPAQRVIGCVVYPASELLAPGVVQHIEGDRFPLGELDGSTQRARAAQSRQCFAARRLQGARARRTSAPRSGSSCGAT
jgi:2-dehydropantoate 2-reductase